MRLPRPRIFFTNIICVCVCLFVHECAHMYICIPNECMYVCMCTFINVHVYMCIYLFAYVCMYANQDHGFIFKRFFTEHS